MRRSRFLVLCVLSAISLLPTAACHKEKSVASARPANGSSLGASGSDLPPDQVVANVRGQNITLAQLDEHIQPQLRDMEEQIQKHKFQLRQQGLEEMIIQQLVKAEAAKRGITDEQFLEAEVDKKVSPPSDQKIKEFFDQNAARLPPGSKFDEYKARIVEILSRSERQERAKTLFERLRKENKVVVKLSEPRKMVEARGPSRGPANAPVTVVEFSDFECPYCGQARDTVEQMMQTYPGKVRLVFRQFPLEFHPKARKAAEAGLCANDQGRFWEYHDVLFKNQQRLDVPQLKEHAAGVGLDRAQFATCLDSGKHEKDVREDLAAGQKVGVPGTPTFFVNGVMLSSASLDDFKRAIEQELETQ